MERPPPIDLDGGDDDDDAPTALVPYGDSPSKRAKTDVLASNSPMEQKQLVSLIQSTIQDTMATSLVPMQKAVQALSEKSATQDGRLEKVEHELGSHHGTLRDLGSALRDMDLKHAKRMDSIQGELVQLQKAVSSPKAAQSPSSLGSPVSDSGLSHGTFDIVIGGWKEGCTRDWVERELAKLLQSVGAGAHVSQTLVFGKRPGFAKFVLNMESHWTPAQRREFQLKVLTRLRAAQWTPGDCQVWITTDKTPKQRRISKAIAQLNAFMRDTLQVDRSLLEVASWAAAKAFVGEFRVTGLSEEHAYGARPTCDSDDLRWLVRDAQLGLNVWLDLVSLSQALGMNTAEVKKHWLAHFGDPSL